jgi:hypothetical protein
MPLKNSFLHCGPTKNSINSYCLPFDYSTWAFGNSYLNISFMDYLQSLVLPYFNGFAQKAIRTVATKAIVKNDNKVFLKNVRKFQVHLPTQSIIREFTKIDVCTS